MRPLKILIHHPVVLPAKGYGGVERVVMWLARGLVERGHEVWIGADPSSHIEPPFRHLPLLPHQSLGQSLNDRLSTGFDLIHFMAPPGDAFQQSQIHLPWLMTVHGNGKPGEVFPKNAVFLSSDHAARHSADAFVYNGIDPTEYRFEPKLKKQEYLFLSKTSWKVKNLRGAVRMCRAAHVKLAIAGGSRPYDLRLRSIFDRDLRWVGLVSGKVKATELAQARALVFPIVWPEPFGLVMVEALMSGTPILACPRGSTPEIVTSEVGKLMESEEEWIDYLASGKASQFMPEDCRARAIEKFSYRIMAENYESNYLKVMNGIDLNRNNPTGVDWRSR